MSRKNLVGYRILVVLAVVGLVCGAPLFAEEYISANDLDAATITSMVDIDGFKIYAASDKNVTVEMIEVARIASDGEVFNARIKLNGSGKIEYRSIHFITKGKAELTVYLNSSSKTDARVLVLCALDGTVIESLTAPPDTGTEAGIAKASIPAAGEYVLYSKGSGINIYQLIVE
ncbi:MAG: hypothetical protein CVV52_04160 [Spirochaetae bacterium HGW-Spirochaetae-8]|nr:MAG: hypothetical protein CVV52_04160 [Spirochaetae bacterium HGW-Spirochaetae-8]